MSYLCVLDINLLLVISFADIFSHSVGHLFILSVVSFALQKPLSLIRPHLFSFAFVSFALGDRSQNTIAMIYIKECSTFVLIGFMVSGLTFRSFIHFEFIFVYGVRKCSNFILLHVGAQFSQNHLLKRLSFPRCMFLPPLLWIN